MWYPAAITVAATSEPVSIEQAREQCSITADDQDSTAKLTRLISVARGYVEKYCNVRFASQTVAVKCDGFCDFAFFPEAPVTSISSISYVDSAGATQTLAASVYELRADGLEVSIALKAGQSWPGIQQGSRITVTAVCGHAACPPEAMHAMLLLVSHWFDVRGPVNIGNITSTLDFTVNDLLCNHRRGAPL